MAERPRANVVRFPGNQRLNGLSWKRKEPAIVVTLPVIRVERYGDDQDVDLADVFGHGPSAPGWKEPRRK